MKRLDTVEIHHPTFKERGLSLVRDGKPRAPQLTIKLDQFAPRYLEKLEGKLQTTLTRPKQASMAARAILDATAICCQALGPSIAVSLAREVAKEMIPPGSPEENALEQIMLPSESVKLRERVYLAQVDNPSPALATTQNVILNPLFAATASKEAGLVAVGHELSHLDHRDIVGNFGDATLKCALSVAGDLSLNPFLWRRADATLHQVELASAAGSRERELRCDRDSAEKLLALGLDESSVLKGFSEIFTVQETQLDPLASHPTNNDRLAAVRDYLDSP